MAESEIEVSIAGGGQALGVIGAGNAYIGSQIINNYYDRPRGEEPAATGSEAIPPCPYMGLAHFGLQDADLFFGRDTVVARLAEDVNRQTLTAVIGASGCGKSSVVLAGLAPHLWRSGNWMLSHFRIGDVPDQPFLALARSLVEFYIDSDSATTRLKNAKTLAEALQTGGLSLHDVFAECRNRNKGTRILLIADQFEEVFTLIVSEPLRHQFLDVLLGGFSGPQARAVASISLILTLRADFLGRPLLHGLTDALQDRIVLLGPMKREELREAIERPAAKAKVSFESGLVERLIDDVEKEPGGLPHLQFALREMWGQQEKRTITHKSYDDVGRLDGAVSKQAESVFARLTRDGADVDMEKTFRRLFTRLVTPGEGQKDTRRVVSRQDLGEKEWSLAQRLAGESNRLVVSSLANGAQGVSPQRGGIRAFMAAPAGADIGTATPSSCSVLDETAEVVHEALIRNWDRLVKWIDIDRDFMSWLRHIKHNVDLWRATPADKGILLRGGMLAQAREWLDTRGDYLSDAERSFIEASIGEEQNERRNLALVKVLVFGVGFATLIGLWWSYRNWQYAQPWAYLEDLNESLYPEQDPRLRGDFVAIGRMDGGPIENKIFIRDRSVSRLHLFVSRNLHAIDWRSLNGTTVNASFLRYGFDTKLEDGDIVALASAAAFKFSVLNIPALPFSPRVEPEAVRPPSATAWGLLIDGRQKTFKYLTEESYFVSKGTKGELVLDTAEHNGREAILKIHRGPVIGVYGISPLSNDSNRHVFVQFKDNDYDYPICQLDNLAHDKGRFYCDQSSLRSWQNCPRIRAVLTQMTACCGRRDEHLGKDVKFAMIPYSREEEPTDRGVECELGPFQIVPVNAPAPQQSAGAGPATQ
jgi:pSer/pThr/pTyr-binding forkhead associated (FHA) protein